MALKKTTGPIPSGFTMAKEHPPQSTSAVRVTVASYTVIVGPPVSKKLRRMVVQVGVGVV